MGLNKDKSGMARNSVTMVAESKEVGDGGLNSMALAVSGLSKVYDSMAGRVVAVDRVSFSV